MDKTKLEKGMVVQLNPETVKNKMFAGCFFMITEEKSFGAMGFVQALGEGGDPGGRAWYRAEWDEMEFVGWAVWVPGEEEI